MSWAATGRRSTDALLLEDARAAAAKAADMEAGDKLGGVTSVLPALAGQQMAS